MTARACTGSLQKISNYLEYFLGTNSNVPLTKGDLIIILNQIVPIQWYRNMISINFQLFNKSMTKVIEYMEKLEVLEATNKQPSTKKQDKDGSEDIQQELNKITIPKNTRIVTCNAISMYTNIDAEHSIEILRKWFIQFKNVIPNNIPTHLVITALEIVMKNNIFTFGDTFWLQKTGTAMCTPCACMIASIYFAYHEQTTILQKYRNNLIFYKQFIDDVFCLWYEQDEQIHITESDKFKEFKRDMNNFGKLQWEFEKLTL